MSVEQLPEDWKGRRVHLLDALLQGRRHVHERHALWFLTGLETVDSLFPFIQGWLARTHLNGGSERAWYEFLDWYEETSGQPLRPDWYVRPLQEYPGDDERTALVLLDLVAEYTGKFGVLPRETLLARQEPVGPLHASLPMDWGRRPVELLDALLWLRRYLRSGGELASVTSAPTVDSLYGFIMGWLRNTVYNQEQDTPFASFQRWLRDFKHAFPGEGWHVYCLRTSQEDHARATLKFLDLVAEFVAAC